MEECDNRSGQESSSFARFALHDFIGAGISFLVNA